MTTSRRLAAIFGLLATALSLLGPDGTTAGATTVPLSVRIVGNHFVNGSGRTIRLLGVNHQSAEYGCVDGFGYDDGHFDDADARAIASWGADAVRVPLNEDCWLGINGQPNSDQGADPRLTRTGYQQVVRNYVADLNRHGIYAILDLHWSAPGAQVALEQQPMPDQDHSPAFWTSVASTFRGNRAVVFDLFNEPYDPTDPRSGSDPNAADKVSWNCWQTGTQGGTAGGAPCSTSAYDENGNSTTPYRVAGMQTLLTAVRTAGATQPVLVGGLDYANDLGDGDHGRDWLTHALKDPKQQVAASFHNYPGKTCDTASCWTGTIAAVAAHVPVVTGEFAEDNFDEPRCATRTPSTFDVRYMTWADRSGVSYLAWGWIVESQAEKDAQGCSAYYLINDYAGQPAVPNGTAVHDHLRALATRKPPLPAITLTTFGAAVRPGNTQVRFGLRSPEHAAGTIAGMTVHTYRTGKGAAHRVALGSVRVTLKTKRAGAATLTLPKAVRSLLVAKKTLAVTFAITLISPQHRRTVIRHTVTLKSVHH